VVRFWFLSSGVTSLAPFYHSVGFSIILVRVHIFRQSYLNNCSALPFHRVLGTAAGSKIGKNTRINTVEELITLFGNLLIILIRSRWLGLYSRFISIVMSGVALTLRGLLLGYSDSRATLFRGRCG
jgi:hypothetical protein